MANPVSETWELRIYEVIGFVHKDLTPTPPLSRHHSSILGTLWVFVNPMGVIV